MEELKKKYALVTGASSGIGYEYADQLAQRGYNLLIVSNEADAIAQKAEILRDKYKLDVISLMMDLGQPGAAGDLHKFCRDHALEVEVLVNNAGVYHDRDFLKDSEGFNNLILNLHVITPAMLCYHFGQDMAARHKGYILNMSSITCGIAVQRLATYSSTKAFLNNFSRCLHVELHGEGVNVTCVRPGAVATGLYNLKPGALRTGLALGYIIRPEKLASKGLKALFKGKARITPGFSSKLLMILVALIPTCVLRLVRKWNIF